MAFGVHWEWRGFGTVTDSFAEKYADLEVYFARTRMIDTYVWIPNLDVNIKLRRGGEAGLKLKRLRRREDSVEMWEENPNELFSIPLSQNAWDVLSELTAKAGMELGMVAASKLDETALIHHFKNVGCRLLEVSKVRESRLWPGKQGKVLVEWTWIDRPERILSIGLESVGDLANGGDSMAEEESAHGGSRTAPYIEKVESKRSVLAAVSEFDLESESLRVMNYLDAVALWLAREKKP